MRLRILLTFYVLAIGCPAFSQSSDSLFNRSLDRFNEHLHRDSAESVKWLKTAGKYQKTKLQECRLLTSSATFMTLYGKMDSAFKLLSKSLKIAEENKFMPLQAVILNNLGVASYQESKNTQALTYHLRALKIRESLKDERGMQASYINMGNVYYMTFDLENSLLYFNKSLALAKKLGIDIEIGKLYNNLGAVYADKSDYLNARKYLLMALPYREKTGNMTGKALTLNALGDVSVELADDLKAEDYYKQALALSVKLGDDMNRTNILNSLGHLAQKRKRYEEAIGFQQRALELSRKIKYLDMERDALIELSENYERWGQPQKALSYYKDYNTIRDSIQQQSNKSQIAELQISYDTEKKERENQKLQFEKNQSETKRRTTIYFFSGLIVFIGLIVFLYLRNKNIRSRYQEEQIGNRALFEGEQKERIRIGRDLHDSIGQMLAVLRMKIEGLTDPKQEAAKETFSILDKTISEVRHISHNLMPEALNFGLMSAIEDLADKISETGKTTVLLSIPEELKAHSFGEQNALSVYRVIQEVLSNMARHADATEIRLEISKAGDKFLITIKDNGKGFDTAKIKDSKGIGWKNINARLLMLDGKMQVASEKLSGTQIEITIPA